MQSKEAKRLLFVLIYTYVFTYHISVIIVQNKLIHIHYLEELKLSGTIEKTKLSTYIIVGLKKNYAEFDLLLIIK